MIARVEKATDCWRWECHVCHLGDLRNRWPDAYAEARTHVRRHGRFGFQPKPRRDR